MRVVLALIVCVLLITAFLRCNSPSPASPSTVKTYYLSGSILSEYQVDSQGRKHGLWKMYHENGVVSQEVELYHGSWTSIVTYWPDGSLKERIAPDGRTESFPQESSTQ